LSELQISETKKTGKPVNKHVVPSIPGVK
jgi:hypothetical protein